MGEFVVGTPGRFETGERRDVSYNAAETPREIRRSWSDRGVREIVVMTVGPQSGEPVRTSVAPRVVFQLRLSPIQLDRWRTAAQERGMPLAQLIREAVEEEIGDGSLLAEVERLRD